LFGKIKTGIQFTKNAIVTSTRVSLEITRRVLWEARDTNDSIDENRQRLSNHDAQILRFTQFLTLLTQKIFHENQSSNQRKIVKTVDDAVATYKGEAIGPHDGTPQTWAGSQIGALFEGNSDLLNQTIVANLWNLIANLSDQAFPQTVSGQAPSLIVEGDTFPDQQRNFLGRLLSLFSLESFSPRLEAIKDSPEENQLAQYDALFEEIATAFFARAFPNGASDLLLFHHTLPVDTIRNDVLVPLLFPMLKANLKDLLKALYFETLPLAESRPNWADEFDQKMAIPGARGLVNALSSLIQTQIIDTHGVTLREQLDESIREWLESKGLVQTEETSSFLINAIQELFETESPTLKRMGSFLERAVMERLLDGLAATMPDDAGLPEGSEPLLVAKLRELLEGDTLDQLVEIFQAADPTESRPACYDIVLRVRTLLGLNTRHNFPLPPRLNQMDWAWELIDDLFNTTLPEKLQTKFIWPAIQNERYNDELIRSLEDQTAYQAVRALIPKLTVSIVDVIRNPSTLQSIITNLPVTLTAEQIAALNTQWVALFADPEGRVVTNIKQTLGRLLEPLVNQVFVNMHAIYLQETHPPSSSTGEQAPRKEFKVWIVEKITAALNEVAIDQFNPGERASLIRIEEIRQLLKTELMPDHRQELSLELKDRTLVMRVKFQRAANRLLQAFGYREASDLPIPAMGKQALWKAIPDLFLEYGAPLLIPAFALKQNREEIAERMDDPSAVIGTNVVVSALSGAITSSLTGASLLDTLSQSLSGISPPADIAAFSRQWKSLFGIQDVREQADQNVNQVQVQNGAPTAPQNVPQSNLLVSNIKNLFGFLLNPLFAQLFVDLRRRYDLEVPPPAAPVDGAQPEPRKEFTVWVIEKITATLNEVGIDRFNPDESAALIRVDELQNLLKTELSPEQKQQYSTELEARSLVVMPKFELASAALFRAFGYERAANLPIPAMGQQALWMAVPKLLLEHGTALIAPSLRLEQNRAQILSQIHDPSPINGINVIVSSLGGLLASLITGPGLLKKLSTSLAKTESPENVAVFNDLWNTFFTPPPATVNPALAVAGGEVQNVPLAVQNVPQEKPLVLGLSKVLTHLLNPVFTQLFVELQGTYLAETTPPVAAEGEVPQPRQEFTLWVVQKLTAVFNELTFDRFPVEQRDILKRALLLKEQVSVESDPVRKQEIAQELEACWTVIKPRFVAAAAQLFQTFGYQQAADLPLPHGQEPLWNYFPELIFDFMSDPLVPFLEREECKAALRAHDFGDGLRAHGLGELIIQGCQATSADLINNLPQYVNSYEVVLQGFNQEAGLPYRLTEGQIPAFATRVAALVEANQLTTETLYEAFEASFLFAHPAYTPQQRTAVMAFVQRYKKQVSTILITPEKIAERLSALNASPAVKAQLAQQIQTLVNRADGPSQPIKEFFGSYIEGMLLLIARQALTLNRETLQSITTLFQETRTRLNQGPHQADPIIAQAEAKEIITEFTDQLFTHLGLASTLDVRGIPFSLGKKIFNEMKKQIVSKLFTVHQIDRLLGLHELGLQANQPANEGTIEQRAIFGAIQSALRSAAEALVKPVQTEPGQPAAAQPQLQAIQDLYTSLRTSLSALGREGYHAGEMLQTLIDNDTFTPYLSSFLVSVNSPENATYQSTAAQLLTPVVTEKVTRILGVVTEKERVRGSDFHQGVLKEMMRTFNTHMRMMNGASQRAGGVNFENYRQAHVEANLPIHRAVPTAAPTEDNKIEQSAQRQAGFFMPMIEDVIQLVFPQGMDELMNLLRNIHPEVVALWESSKRSIGETASSELEKLFKSDVFVTIMNSILESIVNALRQPIVFTSASAPAVRQEAANGAVREVAPLVVNGAGNDPINVLPGNGAGNAANPHQANGPEQLQPRAPNVALNGEVDALIGECINESVRFFDVPVIKSILGMSPEMKQRLRIDRLEGSVYQSIGNAIREQFQGAPIQAGITKAFRELAQTANSGVGAATGAAPEATAGAQAAVVPERVQTPATTTSQQQGASTTAVPPAQVQTSTSTTSQRQGAPAGAVTAQARRGAPAAVSVQVQTPALTPQQRLTQLKGELAKELMVYPFRYLGAYVRHKTTSNYRVVNAITNVVLGLISFVMTKIIGNALRAFKVDRLTKICIENLINNVENRLSLVWTNFQMNENLIYNEVEAFKRAMNENRNDGREEEEI
jgi:hypothetical protein